MILILIVIGAFAVVSAESPDSGVQLVKRSSATFHGAVERAKEAGIAFTEQARVAFRTAASREQIERLRDQGVVTDDFVSRRSAGSPPAPVSPASPAPSIPTAADRRDRVWSREEYESTKLQLFDVMRRLERPAHER